MHVTLPVEGMTCAACQANVQRALTKAPGVTKAAVNLMMHEATVHYDPAATDPAQLVAAINDTGYVSRLPVDADPAPPKTRRASRRGDRSTQHLRTKSLVSLVLGAIAMVVSMPLMGGDVEATARRTSATRCHRWTMTRARSAGAGARCRRCTRSIRDRSCSRCSPRRSSS